MTIFTAWLAAATAMAATSDLLSAVVDQYDKRINEANYRAYAQWSLVLTVSLLMLAFVVHGISLHYPA
jgi:uncharacterized membrane protein required for colicin V production